MKKLLSLLLLAFALHTYSQELVEVNTKMSVLWDAAPTSEAVVSYNLYITSGLLLPVPRVINTTATRLEMVEVMQSLPNGEYTVYVTAVGKSALESDPSASLFIFWYGNKPSRVAPLKVQFTKTLPPVPQP